MKKYFICSDIHSFFNELILTLRCAKFNINNPNHILIIDGDLFNHGNDSVKCFNFIKKLKRLNRLIYIKGNHEHIILKALNLKYPNKQTISTGTLKTFCSFAKWDYEICLKMFSAKNINSLQKWNKLISIIKKSEFIKFIKTYCVNFCEIDNYIVLHSFFPLKLKNNKNPTAMDIKNSKLENLIYDYNWRKNKNTEQWFGACWLEPYEKYEYGLFKPEEDQGKILVCGHWGNPDLYKRHINNDGILHSEILKHRNLICIDSKVVDSKKLNCLVIKKRS